MIVKCKIATVDKGLFFHTLFINDYALQKIDNHALLLFYVLNTSPGAQFT